MDFPLITNEWQDCFAMVPYDIIVSFERELKKTFKNVEENLRLAYLTTKKKDLDAVKDSEEIKKLQKQKGKLKFNREKLSKEKNEFYELLDKFKEISFLLSNIEFNKVRENAAAAREYFLKSLRSLNLIEDLFNEEKLVNYSHLFDFNMKVVLRIQDFVSKVKSDYVDNNEDLEILDSDSE